MDDGGLAQDLPQRQRLAEAGGEHAADDKADDSGDCAGTMRGRCVSHVFLTMTFLQRTQGGVRVARRRPLSGAVWAVSAEARHSRDGPGGHCPEREARVARPFTPGYKGPLRERRGPATPHCSSACLPAARACWGPRGQAAGLGRLLSWTLQRPPN